MVLAVNSSTKLVLGFTVVAALATCTALFLRYRENAVASLDESDRSALEEQSLRTVRKIDNGKQLSIYDIQKMSRAGLSDEVITKQINYTKSTFILSPDDIVNLNTSGVSQKIINTMVLQTA